MRTYTVTASIIIRRPTCDNYMFINSYMVSFAGSRAGKDDSIHH